MPSSPLAIVVALDDEIRVLRSKLSIDTRVHQRPMLLVRGTYERIPLTVIRTGIGRAAMARAMAFCLSKHPPSLLLHVGYCGAASPALSPGDLVIATEIVDAGSGERMAVDGALVSRAKEVAERGKARWSAGAVVTVAEVAATSHEKGILGVAHGAIGIDMESADLAAAARARAVPFLVVRAVLDPLEACVPDLSGAIDAEGATNGMAIAGHLIRKPRDVVALSQLSYYAAQARQALHLFLDAWLREVTRA